MAGDDQRDLAEELEQIRVARETHGVTRVEGVLTSQDGAALRARDHLKIGTPFAGFERWLLPFETGPGDISVVVAEPDSTTPPHSHRDAALHVVISGTITVEGRELGPGDWAYVPAGVEYSLRAGAAGAVVLYPHWT